MAPCHASNDLLIGGPVSRIEQPSERAFAAFLRRHAPLGLVAGSGGLRAHQAVNLEAAWAALRRHWPAAAGPPPYWALAWPGARALSSYLLGQPAEVRGRRVLELGCGGALAAIAAARAGAREVLALDLDPLACRAAAANAAANGLQIEVRACDALAQPADPGWEVVLAADLWYERFLAPRATAWLREAAARGARVLIGDVGRAYSPRAGVQLLQRVELTDQHGTERGNRLHALVSALGPSMRV